MSSDPLHSLIFPEFSSASSATPCIYHNIIATARYLDTKNYRVIKGDNDNKLQPCTNVMTTVYTSLLVFWREL